jgi:hypothetical protein
MTRTTKRFAMMCSAAAIVAFNACSNDAGSERGPFVGGMVSSPSAAFAVQVMPSNATLISLSRAGCPQVQPFTTNMSFILGPTSEEFFFDRLTLRFRDGFGVTSSLFFPNDELVRRFGHTRIFAHTPRTFFFQPQFGCGLSRPRSIDALVGLVDTRGDRHDTTATVTLE